MRKTITYTVYNFSKICCIVASVAIIFSACHSTKKITSTEKKNTAYEKNTRKKINAKYAELLGVDEKEIKNQQLYAFIDEWYGVPYKYDGNTKKGIDCSGLAELIYATVYNKTIKGSAAAIFNQCKEVKQKNVQEGDLLFFKIESKNISHIGVYLQNNKFVHASTKKGVRIDNLNDAYFLKTFYKIGRLP